MTHYCHISSLGFDLSTSVASYAYKQKFNIYTWFENNKYYKRLEKMRRTDIFFQFYKKLPMYLIDQILSYRHLVLLIM